MLDDLTVAAFVLDTSGEVVYLNPAARSLFGVMAADSATPDVRAGLFEAPEQGAVDEVLGRVLTGLTWSGELPLRIGDRGAVRAATAWSPVYEDGSVVGALVLAEGDSNGQAHARTLATRLRRLATVTAELVFAEDVQDVTEIVTEHLADAAGATVASLSLLVDDQTLALAGLRGGLEGASSRWSRYPLCANTPASEAVRTRKTLVLSGREEIHARYPDLEKAADGERSMVCLPLAVADRPIGVTTMSFPGRRSFDAAELEFFGILADTCAQALDRMRALREAADQSAKLRFLAEASAAFGRSLDYKDTLRRVAQAAVPWFADWCSVQLAQDGELRTLEVAHVDAAKVALAEDLQRRYPADPNAPRGAYQVMRTGEPEIVADVTDDLLVEVARDDEHLRLLRALGFRSGMTVPLKVQDRVLGVVAWVTSQDGRRFTEADVAFAEDLARRAAAAIDNAQLHTELREVAVRLQRAVLPAQLPDTPGWDIAVCYQPAGRTDAGGDFYDAVPLGHGRVAVFVGDVMGRGVQAASAMAQMRAALRTLIAVNPEPYAVSRGLDALFDQYGLEQLVTVVYIVSDACRNVVRVVNAGHPCPMILRADGRVEQLTTRETLVLGAGGGHRGLLTSRFEVGDILLAYTDGLVERRGEDIDQGVDRLAGALRTLHDLGLRHGLDHLVHAVRDPSRDDDAAALAIRRTLQAAG